MAEAITQSVGFDNQFDLVTYDELYDVPGDFEGVNKFRELQIDLQVAFDQDTYEETIDRLSFILKDHTNTQGNHKISDTTAIFNMNSAHDCPNRESENCQVPWESCYAGQSERQYGAPLDYRRRQQYLWDCLDADTFVDAFLAFVGRMRKEIKYLRLSEAGDFRDNGDIAKADRIAERLKKEADIQAYTYSASDYLGEWDNVEWLTVNQSNNRREYGDRLYTAIPEGMSPEDIDGLDDNAVQCPNEFDKENGVPAEERKKCGECTLCIRKDSPDIYINIH